MVVHTARWHASVQASTELVPHTVTQVLGVASLARLPIRRMSRWDVQTRSHTKLGSATAVSSSLASLPS